MKKNFLLSMLLILFVTVSAQTGNKDYIIDSKVLDAQTQTPLIYATVYNLQSNYGTATNLEGRFKLQKNHIGDSLRISYLGYNDTIIVLKKSLPETITLHQNAFKIDEITVLADNDDLYNLLHSIRKSYLRRNAIVTDGIAETAKTYYLLESFNKNERVELTEAFFNGYYGDYDLINLKIKKGRTGAKPVKSIFYISSETSQSFYKHELFIESKIFPINPLQLSKNKLKDSYNLLLTNVFVQNDAKIYEIEFTPKSENTRAFAGKIWINTNDESVQKIKLTCENAEKHPFLPYGNVVKIDNVMMTLTKTFFEKGKKTIINTINFNYSLDCTYNSGEKRQFETVAYIKAYDFESQFNLPIFKFSETMHQDFRSITAIPLDNEFWKEVKEFAINTESKGKFDFIEKYRIENKVPTLSLLTTKSHLYNYVYRHWRPERLKMRNLKSEFKSEKTKGLYKDESRHADVKERLFAYELNVKLYLDYYKRNNTMHYVLNSVLDPYKTYFNDELTNNSKAYINMFFDLLEIEKRKLESDLLAQTPETREEVVEIYNSHIYQYNQTLDKFKNDVKRGEVESEMHKWNDIIEKELGVNNIEHFGLFLKGKNK
jgi:hypothetical protein